MPQKKFPNIFQRFLHKAFLNLSKKKSREIDNDWILVGNVEFDIFKKNSEEFMKVYDMWKKVFEKAKKMTDNEKVIDFNDDGSVTKLKDILTLIQTQDNIEFLFECFIKECEKLSINVKAEAEYIIFDINEKNSKHKAKKEEILMAIPICLNSEEKKRIEWTINALEKNLSEQRKKLEKLEKENELLKRLQ